MPCACGCNSCEDRLLSGLSGNLLSGAIARGSRIKVGFELSYLSIYDTSVAGQAIQRCLLDTGGFDTVSVKFFESGALAHEYVTIEGVATLGFARPEDFGDLVEGIIDSCGGSIVISRRDPVQILSIPGDLVGDPSTEQVSNDTGYTGENNHRGNSIESFFDSIARDLGTTSSTVKIGAIALGGLFILQLVKR